MSASFAAVLVAALFIGCGDDDDDDGDNGGGGQVVVDPDPLNLEIQSVNMPATGPATVTFRVTNQAGAPIDLIPELTNANTSTTAAPVYPRTIPRFTLAMLDANGDYKSYYETLRAPSAGWTPPFPLPEGTTFGETTQAAFASPSASATTPFPLETLTSGGNGVYTITLSTPTAGVTGLDRTRTHTVAGYVTRVTQSAPGATADTDVASDSFNFVPGGGTAELDQTITDAQCNHCHGVVQAHGSRRGTQLCITCHSPQTGDPETGRTVDFKVMIHKIHMGGNLPSVQATNTTGPNTGDPITPYYIVGNAGNVHDWSGVAFPNHDGVQHCTTCHSGEDQNNWSTKPNAAACTSCHDNVRFEGAALPSCSAVGGTDQPPAYTTCLHSGGQITFADAAARNSSTQCATCHGPNGPAPVTNFHHGD